MERIGEFIKWYLYITVGILVVMTISCAGMECIPASNLWRILLSGFLTTLVTYGILIWETHGRIITVVKYVAHYVALCVVMVVCGSWFGWMEPGVQGILTMVVSVAVVYALACGAYYLTDRKWAKDINQKLQEMYGDEK